MKGLVWNGMRTMEMKKDESRSKHRKRHWHECHVKSSMATKVQKLIGNQVEQIEFIDAQRFHDVFLFVSSGSRGDFCQ